MRWYGFGLVAVLALSAQTPPARSGGELFQSHCAGCHGLAGEGSRGPALKVPALQRANDIESLAALLRSGIPGTEMPALAASEVADQPLRALAAYVLGLRTMRSQVDPAQAATSRLGRGEELFRTKGKCLDCHRVNGEGHASGPDLTDIGRQRDSQWLRRAVTEPESAIYDSFAGYRWTILIPDNYLLVDIVTRTGERVTGSRLNEDAFSIQVRDQEGRIRSFLKTETAELRKHWGKSPMPSYKDAFSAGELDDLVGYLAGLRGLR
ncbi:MAG TPA: c-type cytochrome [Candidatus Acidoferrales bacterium]|nr:c-type cytochrome [Candidatus Acidoferrales bacterium]